MNEVKEKALAKMLEEMNKEHSASEDRIHNWLCDQEDDALFEGVLKEGYTIKSALTYAKNKAREFAQNGVACIDDTTVFDWVREYFLSNSSLSNIRNVPFEPVAKPKNKPEKKKLVEATITKPSKKEKGVVEGQLDLFAELAI